MKKSRETSRALLLSLVLIFACLAVFVGVTYAWFTDEATNSGNKIQAGTLQVELQQEVGGTYVNVSGSELPIFTETNWAPGAENEAKLKIVNKGTLALNYNLTFDGIALPASGVSLADVIDVYVNGTFLAPLSYLANGQSIINGTLAANSTLDAEFEFTVKLVFWEDAGSNYEGLEVGGNEGFDVKLLAAQTNDISFAPKLVSLEGYKREVVKTIDAAEKNTLTTGAVAVEIPANVLGYANVETKFVAEVTSDWSGEFDIGSLMEPGGSVFGITSVDCKLTAGTTEITAFTSPVTVTVYIAKGLPGVSVVCEKASAEPSSCTFDHCLDSTYNPVTGELTFKTDHFSKFVVQIIGNTVDRAEWESDKDAGQNLKNAILNAKPGEFIFIEEGVYDIPCDKAGNRRPNYVSEGTYLPILANNVSIIGLGNVVITSTDIVTTFNWYEQDLIVIHGNGVVLSNLTIMDKVSTNKSIEIVGKDVTLKDIKVLRNTYVTAADIRAAFTEDVEIEVESTKGCSGSVYFNPEKDGGTKDIGNAIMENVYIDNAGIGCSAGEVTAGTLTLKGVTIDITEWYWANYDYGGFYSGVMGKNDAVYKEAGDGLTVKYKPSILGDINAQVYGRVPSFAKLINVEAI